MSGSARNWMGARYVRHSKIANCHLTVAPRLFNAQMIEEHAAPYQYAACCSDDEDLMAASMEALAATITVETTAAIAATSAEKNTCGDLRCTDEPPAAAFEGCCRLCK
jgi:hypothetical protein